MQRLEGQGGVAQPAVAVVPVALAAEVLGQRGGRRRHDAAGVVVGQQAQGEQGAAYDVARAGTSYVAARRPTRRRSAMVCVDPVVEVERSAGASVRRDPGRREGQLVARRDVELVDVAAVDRPIGSRGPRSTSLSGPATAVITSSPLDRRGGAPTARIWP